MKPQIALLRGINLGSRNRVSMPELREALTAAGLADVRTHLQSGNVVVTTDLSPEKLARKCGRLLVEKFGLDVPVIVRSRDELVAVVERNPLGRVATDPKRYQVSFLADEPDPEAVRTAEGLAAPEEEIVAIGREIYAWHPRFVARSKLWSFLASDRLGVPATARNWRTVEALLALADA